MGSIRQKPSGKWEVRYVDPEGRLRGKSFVRKSDAVVFEKRIETEKSQGTWLDPRLGQTKFGDFAERWLQSTVHLKPATQVSYEMLLRRHILPRFGKVQVARIDRGAVQGWLAALMAGDTGAGTVRNAYRVFARILAEAERGGLIGKNPARGIPLPKSSREEMKFLSPTQVTELAETADPRFRALILMASYTGMRFGELAALRVDRLDLLRGRVEITESVSEVHGRLQTVTPKSGERRTIPLPRFLCSVLTDHIGRFSTPDGLVFSSPEGGPLRRNFYRRHFKPALHRAGLDPDLRFHDLRHSAASIAIATGANVKQVQQMLGHSSATVTLDTYAHILPSLADQLRNALDDVFQEVETERSLVPDWSRPANSVVAIEERSTQQAP